ncbi:ABC transporter permease subunit, partial [Bacillus sp. S34]|nr:ABC transporter permease subunit [Bacillus sp. S34]
GNLVEYGTGALAKGITFFVDVMTGIPSIVAGLFAYSLFALFLGPGARFGLVGSVALSVLMIPIVVRSTEEVLKIVPMELREASYALGVVVPDITFELAKNNEDMYLFSPYDVEKVYGVPFGDVPISENYRAMVDDPRITAEVEEAVADAYP